MECTLGRWILTAILNRFRIQILFDIHAQRSQNVPLVQGAIHIYIYISMYIYLDIELAGKNSLNWEASDFAICE